jgi:glyoxylate carboligase
MCRAPWTRHRLSSYVEGLALLPGEAISGKAQAMKKGSDLLVEALENEGVERVFGIPGEENLDVESLRTSKIELVLTRHEQAAAFMAATHGRLTGKPGVCSPRSVPAR